MNWNIDFTIVAVYLLVTLGVGIYKGRNVSTVREYAVADRTYSTAVMVATITATMIDAASTMGLTEKIFIYGPVFLLLYFGEPIAKIFMAFFIVPRMNKFYEMISVGDIMNRFYGKPGGIITGIAGIILALGYVAAQVSAIGYCFYIFLDMSYILGTLIGCGIVILYSAFGGIKAVTATDAIQFILMITMIPILCDITVTYAGGYASLWNIIPVTHSTVWPEGNSTKYIWLLGIFYLPFLDPAITQRMLMAKNGSQLKKSLLIAAAVEVPMYIYISIIGLVGVVLYPHIEAAVVMPHIINTLLPVGVKGLCIATILAIVMSSADSYLNVASINLVHDVLRQLLNKPLADKIELKLTKLFTVLLGIVAVFIALQFQSILDLILNFLGVWAPVVVIPLLAGIFGFKASSKSFVLSAAGGITAFILWKIFASDAGVEVDALIPSMLVNALLFFGSHYYFKRQKNLLAKGVAYYNL